MADQLDDKHPEVYHVNARLSRDLQDVGRASWRKAGLLLLYCARAVWARLKHRAKVLYYVPAAPMRASLYRDWLAMLLCRGLFRCTVFHWHAVGLGEWLEAHGKWWERRVSHVLMDRADLAIVLSGNHRSDAEFFRPRRVSVVPNGIPDPCPDYTQRIAPQRRKRLEHRRRLLLSPQAGIGGAELKHQDPVMVNVLFMAHCTRDKGLFDAVEGVRLANGLLAERTAHMRFRLWVAGDFRDPVERHELERILSESDPGQRLEYLGFLSGSDKASVLERADLFCFPTYYASEGQPLNLLEAMAFGLPIITTHWRSIPELLPPDYPGLVQPRHPEQIAAGLLALMVESGDLLRDLFLEGFVLERHLANLNRALLSLNDA